jgi:ABC-type glutathione transport system ATPase component
MAANCHGALMTENAESLLRIEGLTLDFDVGKPTEHRALGGVSLKVGKGEVVALIGESGAGKTVFSHSVLGLLPKSARVTGKVLWRGVDLLGTPRSEMQRIRGRQIGMIFQDPQASLNPLYPASAQIGWIVRHHLGLRGHDIDRESLRLLDSVKLANPQRVLGSYPDELSGGMCQRVMIAMAIASKPSLLIADEPTSALDISVATDIVALLGDLRTTLGLSILLVTHDLGIAARVADRILVMERGRIVEDCPARSFLSRAAHEASRRLCDAYKFMHPYPAAETATVLQA